jgi:AcrR family transcriptional regulator
MPITDKGLATRNKIIDTACQLFISQGYHATSTRSIAQASGIAAGAMYNHFHGKDEIFIEVLLKYHQWREIPLTVKKPKG